MRWFIFGVLSLLAACSAPTHYSSVQRVQESAYVHDGPTKITLYTMINNRSGEGAHSALMVNGSQRVIFDPAGTIKHDLLIERDDVLYGITPRILDFYVRTHARETYHVVAQTVAVSPQVAEIALNRVIANGAVTPSFCARSVSGLLPDIPGFERINQTFFPKSLMNQFANLPGVKTQVIRENDNADKTVAVRAFNPNASVGE